MCNRDTKFKVFQNIYLYIYIHLSRVKKKERQRKTKYYFWPIGLIWKLHRWRSSISKHVSAEVHNWRYIDSHSVSRCWGSWTRLDVALFWSVSWLVPSSLSPYPIKDRICIFSSNIQFPIINERSLSGSKYRHSKRFIFIFFSYPNPCVSPCVSAPLCFRSGRTGKGIRMSSQNNPGDCNGAALDVNDDVHPSSQLKKGETAMRCSIPFMQKVRLKISLLQSSVIPISVFVFLALPSDVHHSIRYFDISGKTSRLD